MCWQFAHPRMFRMERRRSDVRHAMEDDSNGRPLSRRRVDEREVSWDATRTTIYAMGTAAGLCDPHARDLMHRDVKPAHVLLDANMYPKVCGFDLMRWMPQTEADGEMAGGVGTPLFMASKLFSNEDEAKDGPAYDQKVDVYAFAVFLQGLLTVTRPWAERQPLSQFTLHRLVEQGERSVIAGSVPDRYGSLIVPCWAQKPERPSMREVLKTITPDPRALCLNRADEEEVIAYVASVLTRLWGQ